jgi:hypothetical protein
MITTLGKYQKLIAVFLFELFFAQMAYAHQVYLAPLIPIRDRSGYAARFERLSHTAEQERSFHLDNEAPLGRTAYKEQSVETGNAPTIGGPGQPEMSSFKSINAANSVDLFTGDFSYNIPLMDVGGYPVNIHYNSGISMDQEASWVGLGWNINPGTIGRTTRGLPDDFNGSDSIVRTQSIKENKTVGATLSGTPEVKGRALPFTIGVGAFHNNYNGWGTESFLNVSINAGKSAKGHLSGSLSFNNNSQTGLNVQPSLSTRLGKKDNEWNGQATLGTNYNSRSGISALQLHTEVRWSMDMDKVKRSDNDNQPSTGGGVPSSINFATPSYLPTITVPMTNSQFSFKLKVGAANWTVFTNAAVLGYVSRSYIAKADQRQALPAYGYLYFSQGKTSKALLDFNREKDIAFNAKTSPHIAIPQYSYDVYALSGEGISGSFRPYRGDVGYINDHTVATKSESSRITAEMGFGQYFHGGLDFDNTTATTRTGAWVQNNDLVKNLKFLPSDTTFEEVYFRNPGEQSILPSSFTARIGGDSLISVKLSGEKGDIKAESVFTKYAPTLNPAGEIPVSAPLAKDKRAKRSQLITYFKAEDAAKLGLDTLIRSYTENSNPVLNCNDLQVIKRVEGMRKPHHLSQINVINPDGRRYVYGLPAYNISQEDVVFSVDQEVDPNNIDGGLVKIKTGDDSLENTRGKDSYYTRDSTPAHAHSFLLTGILSPDYVDIKGDGISEDDPGDAVKFNYTQVYGPLKNNAFHWRTPHQKDKGNYNEGLKTYNRDDKGSYLYGKKEVWYLNSIESKTMIAIFKVSTRTDAFSVDGVKGGHDFSKALRKLDSIQLFSKADLIKNGGSARPIKTVHFEYETKPEGQLCRGIIGDDLNTGKLTLKKIWFTYNNNRKGQRNPYVFYYHPGTNNHPKAAANPSYNPKRYDRWGNFKEGPNPGGLSNADYPYAVKDYDQAAQNASVWHLTDIKLPSGGRMKVTYESDDYAFVQNKRALQMTTIAGFGSSPMATPSPRIYNGTASYHDFVFIDGDITLKDAADVYRQYLQGLEDRDGNLKIYFKLAVKMPFENDAWSTATKYELVPGYAEVESYGLTGTGGSKRFYLKLKRVGDAGVLAKTALQFLRLNLPSKAYPTSEIGSDVSVGQVVKTIASSLKEISNAVNGFEDQQRLKHHCENVVLDKSFVRLGIPSYRKFGGGIRVKRVELFDNWNAMTGQKESVYGQEYQYTTAYVRGLNDTISISSGVAAYEPMIGGDENPFHLPMEYKEKLAPLGPSNYLYTTTPLGESFFPSPMVGYSKVRVRTIHYKVKSANGWTETEYYTTRDFPTLVDHTPIDKRAYNPKFNILKVNTVHHLTVSQGFRIELNDMNGKVKAASIYAENDSLRPIHYSANFYKVENDLGFTKRLSNHVWTIDSATGRINKNAEIGKEIEVMVDVREQVSNTFSGNLGVNVDVIPGFVPPFIPLPSSIPLPQREESRFRSVAVSKIVQRYGILDSIVVINKGSVVSTKNLVFDAENGQVLVSRTNNEFNDPLYNFSYPARWAYSGMGMAYENAGLILKNKKLKDGKLVEWDETPSPSEKHFESGDEVWLVKAIRGQVTPNTATTCGTIQPTTVEANKSKKLWVVDAAKGKQGHQGLYFVDEHGKPYTGLIEKMQIIRSGKRNMVDAFVGSITSLVSPVREVSPSINKVIIDDQTKVIGATAVAFKDLWTVENSLYQKDSCYTKTAVKTVTLYPIQSMLMREYSKGGGSDIWKNTLGSAYFTASLKNYPNCSGFQISCRKTRTFRSKSIIKFDFSSIPAGATLSAASLDLYPKSMSGLWNGVGISEIDQYLSDKTNAHYVRDNQDARSRTNASILQRVRNPWSTSTQFANISTYPETVAIAKTADNVCDSRTGLGILSLVQPLIGNPAANYGFQIRLADDGHGNKNDYQFRSMSFCTGIGALAPYTQMRTSFATSTASGDMTTMAALPTCADCYSPSLTLTYTYQKDTCVRLCRDNIIDTTNPYRWGVLGNWRADRSFVYYHEREENNAALTQTNIRKEGVLKGFVPYWQFSTTALKPTSDTTRWVWNSASSLYNQKGMEVENYDALGRFNAGLYGYNQTLPVAVAQNSKYRELLYDGFEDYDYHTRRCDTVCTTPRPIDFRKGNASASTYAAESHTGRYSLMVAQGGQAVFSAPLTTAAVDASVAGLSMKVDSTPIYITTVQGKGTGLSAVYSCSNGSSALQRIEGPIDFTYGSYPQPLPSSCNGLILRSTLRAEWSGKLQPKFSEIYTLQVTTPSVLMSSSGPGIMVSDPATGTVVLTLPPSLFGGTRVATTNQPLQAGKLYDIRITYPTFSRLGGAIQLSWASARQQTEVIPRANLYPANVQTADTVGSVIRTIKEYCIKPGSVVQSNVVAPKFSPLQGKKMVVSVWMKVPEFCASGVVTTLGTVTASFNTGGSVTLARTGVPVEGWQRYESEVTIPETATQLYLTLKANGSPVLFDDVRMHPYNSTVKSYVYDPVSLRLMSELDENNYASFYEYDDDGTLIRVKKETEKGIQTVKETRSALRTE